jgi:ABC-type branched-subunit amino acid transport system ATPase component
MRTVVGNQLTSIISQGKCNFKDLTVSCIQGQVVGMVGSDPSGLSQLMGIMAGHLNPVSGRVLFDGSELGQKGGEVSYPLEMFTKGLILPSVGFLERIFSSSKYTLSRADLILRFFPTLKLEEVKKGSKLTGQDKAPVRLSHYLSFSHKAFYLDFPFEGFSEEQIITSLKLVRELADRFKDLILINGCDLEKLKTVCDVIYSIDTNAEVFEKNPKPVYDDSPAVEIAK